MVLKGLVTSNTNTSKYYIRFTFQKESYEENSKLDFSNNEKIVKKQNKEILLFGETISFNRISEKYQICLAFIKGVVVKNIDKSMLTDETYSISNKSF